MHLYWTQETKPTEYWLEETNPKIYWTDETIPAGAIYDINTVCCVTERQIFDDNFERQDDSTRGKVPREEKLKLAEKGINFTTNNTLQNSLINCADDSENIPERNSNARKNVPDALKNVPSNASVRNAGSRGRKQNIRQQNSFLSLTIPNSVPSIIPKIGAVLLPSANENVFVLSSAEVCSTVDRTIPSAYVSTSTSLPSSTSTFFSTLLHPTSNPSEIAADVLDRNHNENSKINENVESVSYDDVEVRNKVLKSRKANTSKAVKSQIDKKGEGREKEKEEIKSSVERKSRDDIVEMEERDIILNENSDDLKLRLNLETSSKTLNRIIKLTRVIVVDAYALEKMKLKFWEVYLSEMIKNDEKAKKICDVEKRDLSINCGDVCTKNRIIRSCKIVDLSSKEKRNCKMEILRKSVRGTVAVLSNFGEENSNEKSRKVDFISEKNNSDVSNKNSCADRIRIKRNNNSINNESYVTACEGNANDCIDSNGNKENVASHITLQKMQMKNENKSNEKLVLTDLLDDFDSMYDFKSITVSDRREYNEELPSCFVNRSRIMGNSNYKYVSEDGKECVEYQMNGVIGKGAFGYAILSHSTSTYAEKKSNPRNKKEKDLELKFQSSFCTQTKGI